MVGNLIQQELKIIYTYIRWSKLNFQVTGKTKSYLDNLLSRNEASSTGEWVTSNCVFWPKNPHQCSLLIRLLVVLHKLTVRSYWQEQHLYNSLNMETSSWYLPRAFTLWTNVHGTVRYSVCYQKRKVNTNLSTNCLLDMMIRYCNNGKAKQS